MAHLSKFGLENFRVFRDEIWFDFKPTTIITGQNSSGKTSLFKALKVLRNNIVKNEDVTKALMHFNTKFEAGDNESACLGAFQDCLSHKSGKDYLSYSFEVKFPEIKESLILKTFFKKKPKDDRIEAIPYRFCLLKATNAEVVFDYTFLGVNHNACIDIDFFRKGFEKHMIDSELPLRFNPEFPILPFLPFLFIKQKGGDSSNFYKSNSEVINRIFPLYNFESLSNVEVLKLLKRNEALFFREISTGYRRIVYYKERFGDISLFETIKDKSMAAYEKYVKGNRVDYEFPPFFERYEKWIKENIDHSNQSVNFKVFNQYLKDGLTKIFQDLRVYSQIEFVDSIRINNQRIFTNESSNRSFYKLLVDYLILSKKDNGKRPDIAFVKKYLRDFGISKTGEFTIKSFEDYSGIQVFIDDRLVSDYGSGVNHLFHILIKVCVIFLRYNSGFTYYDESIHSDEDVFWKEQLSVFIEEPELNLHPNLQSKLADMFIEANKEFGIQFIIETHSEYLIRRLQILTLDKQLKPDETSIYYFYNPDIVPKGRCQVERIRILEDGNLDNDFGEGFFDLATNMKFDLVRMRSSKN